MLHLTDGPGVDGALLCSVLDQAPEAVVIASVETPVPTVVYGNRAFGDLLRVDPRQLPGRPLTIGPSIAGEPADPLWPRLRAGHIVRWESCERAGDDARLAEWCLSPVRHGGDAVTHVVAIVHDVTEQRRESQRLAFLASHDMLTGLWTRAPFEETLERLIARAERTWSGAVLLVDIDRFKAVNDSHGHRTGDAVIRSVAGRMADALRPGDLIARLGGDEFGIILEDVSQTAAFAIAERVRRAASSGSVRDGDARVRVTVSGGLAAILPGGTAAAVVAAADRALYAAKHAGRDRVAVAPGPPLPAAVGLV